MPIGIMGTFVRLPDWHVPPTGTADQKAPPRTRHDHALVAQHPTAAGDRTQHRSAVTTPPELTGPTDDPRPQAEQMRLRLAANRLRESRRMDLGEAQLADLVLAKQRLEAALEDMIGLARDLSLGSLTP